MRTLYHDVSHARGVGDPRDGVLADADAVDPGEVRVDLARRQALGIQQHHPRVHIGQPSLPLADNDRVEGAVPVTRHLDLDPPDRVRHHRLVRLPLRELAPLRPSTACLMPLWISSSGESWTW